MDNFSFWCGTKIIFGRKSEEKTGEETRKYAKRILLHYGQNSIKSSGLYGRVTASLRNADIDFIELPGVVPNPRIGLVREGIKICRENNIELILAVGGGSVIDSAKAIAAGFFYEGDVWELFAKPSIIRKALPVATVLTIPAAGSEASPGSVITNESLGRKLHISGDALRPVFSILNPELTVTLPEFQTACGVTDMIAHIFERYFTNTKHVDLTDTLCEGMLRSIIRNARLVMKEPANYDYRAEIMWASTIAHNGLLGTGRMEDWATHRIEHELSAFYDIAHGAGLAVMFPAWMKYVYKHDTSRFSRFASEVWGIIQGTEEEKAIAGIRATEDFFREIGLKTTLKEIGITEDRLAYMAEQAAPKPNLGSFIRLGKEDVLSIYKLALG